MVCGSGPCRANTLMASCMLIATALARSLVDILLSRIRGLLSVILRVLMLLAASQGHRTSCGWVCPSTATCRPRWKNIGSHMSSSKDSSSSMALTMSWFLGRFILEDSWRSRSIRHGMSCVSHRVADCNTLQTPPTVIARVSCCRILLRAIPS